MSVSLIGWTGYSDHFSVNVHTSLSQNIPFLAPPPPLFFLFFFFFFFFFFPFFSTNSLFTVHIFPFVSNGSVSSFSTCKDIIIIIF